MPYIMILSIRIITLYIYIRCFHILYIMYTLFNGRSYSERLDQKWHSNMENNLTSLIDVYVYTYIPVVSAVYTQKMSW